MPPIPEVSIRAGSQKAPIRRRRAPPRWISPWRTAARGTNTPSHLARGQQREPCIPRCCWAMCPAMIWGGKKQIQCKTGTIETSCANTWVPAEPAQPYREKKGSASPVMGDRTTEAVHAIRSTLNGPTSAHNTLNAAGAMWMMASRDGHEIASAAPFSAGRDPLQRQHKTEILPGARTTGPAMRESRGSWYAPDQTRPLPTGYPRQ